MAAEPIFDFTRAEADVAADDVIVRTVAVDDDDVWVEVLITGRRGIKVVAAYSDHFRSDKEAYAWLQTTTEP
jgi:hypothetical protein